MKIVSIFILSLLLFNATAQRVGIGSTQFTPSSTLDVKGNMTIGNNYSGSSAASSNGLIVEGNVGIGTSAAGFLLDVAGRARLRTGGGSAGVWFMNNANSADRAFIGMNNDNIFGIYGAGGAWYFNLNVTNGRVGIGTTDPQNILHVVGSGTSTIRIVDGNQGANKVLTSDASGNATWQTASSGATCYSRMAVFDASGTWTIPAGVTQVMIEVWGGGGAGGVYNVGYQSYWVVAAGGGGGGYAMGIYTIASSPNLTINVGAAGVPCAAPCNLSSSTRGGTTSVLQGATTLLSATGGMPASATSYGYAAECACGIQSLAYDYDYGVGGTGNGVINIPGDDGLPSIQYFSSGPAPESLRGGRGGKAGGVGGGAGGGSLMSSFAWLAMNGKSPGGGGAGALFGTNRTGGNGAAGRVIIWY